MYFIRWISLNTDKPELERFDLYGNCVYIYISVRDDKSLQMKNGPEWIDPNVILSQKKKKKNVVSEKNYNCSAVIQMTDGDVDKLQSRFADYKRKFAGYVNQTAGSWLPAQNSG